MYALYHIFIYSTVYSVLNIDTYLKCSSFHKIMRIHICNETQTSSSLSTVGRLAGDTTTVGRFPRHPVRLISSWPPPKNHSPSYLSGLCTSANRCSLTRPGFNIQHRTNPVTRKQKMAGRETIGVNQCIVDKLVLWQQRLSTRLEDEATV